MKIGQTIKKNALKENQNGEQEVQSDYSKIGMFCPKESLLSLLSPIKTRFITVGKISQKVLEFIYILIITFDHKVVLSPMTQYCHFFVYPQSAPIYNFDYVW